MNGDLDSVGLESAAPSEIDRQRLDLTPVFDSLVDLSEPHIVAADDEDLDDWTVLSPDDASDAQEDWEELDTALLYQQQARGLSALHILAPNGLVQDLEEVLIVACQAQALVERLVSSTLPPTPDAIAGKVPNVNVRTLNGWKSELWAANARLNWRSQRSDSLEAVSRSTLSPESVWDSMLAPDTEVLRYRSIERVEVVYKLSENLVLLQRAASFVQDASDSQEIQLTSLAFRLGSRNGDTQCVGIASVSACSIAAASTSNQDTQSFAWAADECECWFFSRPDASTSPWAFFSNQWTVDYAGYQQVADPLEAATDTAGRCDPAIATRLTQLALDVLATPQRIEQQL